MFTKTTERGIVNIICSYLDTPDLLCFCLAARAFREPAQAAIFRDIWFQSSGAHRTNGTVEVRQKLRDLHRALSERPALGHYIHSLYYDCFKSPEAHERFLDIVRFATGLKFLSFKPLTDLSNNDMIAKYRQAFEQSKFLNLCITLTRADDLAYIPSRRLNVLKIYGPAVVDESVSKSSWGNTPEQVSFQREASQVDISHCKIDVDVLVLRQCQDYYASGIGKDEWYLSSFLAGHLVSPRILCMEQYSFTPKGLAKILGACGENIEHLTLRADNASNRSGWPNSAAVDRIFRWARWSPKLRSLAIDNIDIPSLGTVKTIERLSWKLASGQTVFASLRKLTTLLENGFSPPLTQIHLIGNVYGICDKMNGGWGEHWSTNSGWGKDIDDQWVPNNEAWPDRDTLQYTSGAKKLDACRNLLRYFQEICNSRSLAIFPANYVEDCMVILNAYEVITSANHRIAGPASRAGLDDITGLPDMVSEH